MSQALILFKMNEKIVVLLTSMHLLFIMVVKILKIFIKFEYHKN